MLLHGSIKHEIGPRSPMLYGHFIEHFHRQIYGGIYDPDSPLSDEDGFRTDVLEALRQIKIPILRWPGGCFVSSYHWKEAVGSKRNPFFDKAWRVEDPNTFGTDEYIKLCRKLHCEPYICTNAGTGTAEEMSDWVEYCNLPTEGKYAKWRIENGFPDPHQVKYWSIGNENYGFWEIGAKDSREWSRLVKESAKMIKHVDPLTQLSAAALTDLDWNIRLLTEAGDFLNWISIHQYWDPINQTNDYANYKQCMAYTYRIGHSIEKIRGLLTAMNLEKKIKIAFDEWNLRGWYHPNVHTIQQGITKEEYLYPRDKNDDNTRYTMADAVFTACFLNELNRNCDIVGMANYAPAVNTRGCIFTHSEGIVLRTTYHVFDLYTNYMGDIVLNTWYEDMPSIDVESKDHRQISLPALDILATKWSDRSGIAVAAVNKDHENSHPLQLKISGMIGKAKQFYISGSSTESYNDINHEEVKILEKDLGVISDKVSIILPPHSVSVIHIE